MLNTAATAPEEQPLVLSSLPPSQAQKRLAAMVVLGSLAIYLTSIWQLPGMTEPYLIPGFVPSYFTTNVLIELITAVLLFAQFSTLHSRAILLMANGYLFATLLLIPMALTIPGAFGPNYLVGGPQSTVWVYFFSRAGFALFVIGYALLKGADPAKRFHRGMSDVPITLSVAVTAILVFAISYLCIRAEFLLPEVMLDAFRYGRLSSMVGVPIALLSFLAIFLLWRQLSSVLDLWLLVAMCLIEIQMLNYYFDPVRYGIGWYTIRAIGLLGNSVVLIVLLYEIETLYARLHAAVNAQRHEREVRMLTGDAVAAATAHEIRQPLTAIITSADAGARFLDRSTPNLEKAKEAFKNISADGHRAGEVVESIRAAFKHDVRNRTPLDVNDIIGEAIALERGALQKHQILVHAEPTTQLPKVQGDRVQLKQVLLNLITNAIDSMAAKDEPRVLRVKSEAYGDDGVMVSVADTGTGIDPQDVDRIFNPLFTTKTEGMGMGLAICRSIIEAHEGRLWVAPNTPRGAVFQFSLQASNSMSTGA